MIQGAVAGMVNDAPAALHIDLNQTLAIANERMTTIA
jgi:hypothetical protein